MILKGVTNKDFHSTLLGQEGLEAAWETVSFRFSAYAFAVSAYKRAKDMQKGGWQQSGCLHMEALKCTLKRYVRR